MSARVCAIASGSNLKPRNLAPSPFRSLATAWAPSAKSFQLYGLHRQLSQKKAPPKRGSLKFPAITVYGVSLARLAFFWQTYFMAKSIAVNQKKKRGRGRPATGRDPVIALRLPKQTIVALDRWASAEGLTRSAAARRLIERGLQK
jgi:hypothetical protein